MAQHKDTSAKTTPRPSQAEGEREAIEEATGDRNNSQQTKREQAHSTPEENRRPSQAEGEDR